MNSHSCNNQYMCQNEEGYPPLKRQTRDDCIQYRFDEINDEVIDKKGWTAPHRVWEALDNKEQMEEFAMQQQFTACQQKMYGDFLIYKEEMKQRRERFLTKVGPQLVVEQAYHIPFWVWWGEYLTRKY